MTGPTTLHTITARYYHCLPMMYFKRNLADTEKWSQSSGCNIIPRRARPGLAGLRPHTTLRTMTARYHLSYDNRRRIPFVYEIHQRGLPPRLKKAPRPKPCSTSSHVVTLRTITARYNPSQDNRKVPPPGACSVTCSTCLRQNLY